MIILFKRKRKQLYYIANLITLYSLIETDKIF